MPNGVYPIPPFNSHPNHATDTRPGLWLRFWTRWNRRHLDDELARGTDPAASDQLTLRAAQLRSRAVRVQLASRLIDALGAARRPNLEPLTARGRRQRVAVEESRDDLEALIRRLQDVRQPVAVRGVAMTAQVVRAGVGGRHRHEGQNLRQAVRAAWSALDTTAPSDRSLATAA